MLKRFSLRTKIMFAIGALVTIALMGGGATIWMVNRMDSAVSAVISSKVAALNISQELESSLAMQRGLLSYFYIDGHRGWLEELDRHRFDFEKWLKSAREVADSDAEREILNNIESKYVRYTNMREEVIALYDAGKREEGYKLHREVRNPFYAIRELCEQFKQIQYERVGHLSSGIRSQVIFFDTAASLAMLIALGLGITLGVLLWNRVLVPIRLLMRTAGREGSTADEPDEVKALGRRIEGLIESVDTTRIELEQSREHLLQTEKLAQIGKLAAGVAHSVRNPLTSVKMRLFTMERTLALSPAQKEDFDVISEEIRHIDTIVQNFLEFSRPPKLKIQNVSPSDVVDLAIQLLQHRLESFGVSVDVVRERRLPEIDGDPEQLKEVFVNLIVNACEAMGAEGGSIVITEEEGISEPVGQVAVVRVSDSGPGIPDSIKDKIFQPFFTTKEEGTGLGLSIACRIIEEHKGCLSVKGRPSKGTTFIITLPCKEDGTWLRS